MPTIARLLLALAGVLIGVAAAFAGPETEETASYWQRTGFYKYAEELFEMHGHVPRQRQAASESIFAFNWPVRAHVFASAWPGESRCIS